jgi:hypothetical protein
MSGPLNFKPHTTNGGSYGTNSTGSASGSISNNNNNSNTTTRRQRRNPSDYGPFTSPHGSFDDHNNPTASFPPYAELPFTSLKRRRQLQDNNSFVKWAMRAVLLSPVVVLVLWSVAAVMFATTHTHQVAQTQQQRNGNSNTNSSNNSNVRQQSQRRGIRRMFGNGSNNNNNNNVQPNVVYNMQSDNTIIQQQQQLQDQQGNLIYNVNGNAMMMVPQQQLQGIPLAGSTLNVVGGQQSMPAAGQFVTATGGYKQQQQQMQQQQAVPLQPQGQQIPVFPLGSTSNQQQILQPVQLPVPQQVAAAAGSYMAVQPQQVFTAQQQQIPIASLDNAVVAAATDFAIQTAMQQPMTTSTAGLTDNNNNNNNVVMQQQPRQQLQMSSDSTTTGTSSVAREIIQDQLLQGSPSKQAVYFYDPKDTTMSRTGDILQLPTLVYDAYGNAISLTELHQQAAPIYVQPPLLGSGSIINGSTGAGAAASTSTTASDINVVGAAVINPAELLLSESAPLLGATSGSESASSTSTSNIAVVGVVSSNPDLVLLSESAPLGASITMPQAWGSSTSQDQTIIIATVAVMALLVGALSARRLRSKSFLSSCIENETLEDDAAYDDAYTTTAAASGAVGADSSYNTFGGWKGDLEKFDV